MKIMTHDQANNLPLQSGRKKQLAINERNQGKEWSLAPR
jgi:hypothetical protein